MENSEMGRVVVDARIENLVDAFDVKRGLLPPSEARSVTVKDALVDTGATSLSLPLKYIAELGLNKVREQRMRTSVGTRMASIYEPVRLTVQDRNCVVEVVEVADDVRALIGQIPLEWLDFVVDPNGQRLIGNPAHGGEQMLEMY